MEWWGIVGLAVLTNLVLFGPATVALLVAHFYDDIFEMAECACPHIPALDAAICRILTWVGSESAAPAQDAPVGECVVCLDERARPSQYLYLCAHRCICNRCDRRAFRAQSSSCNVCPLCRAPRKNPWFGGRSHPAQD